MICDAGVYLEARWIAEGETLNDLVVAKAFFNMTARCHAGCSHLELL